MGWSCEECEIEEMAAPPFQGTCRNCGKENKPNPEDEFWDQFSVPRVAGVSGLVAGLALMIGLPYLLWRMK